MPVKYRTAIREGVLEWNKAFERIGYKDAIKVEIQPDDAKFNTSDIRHASIRWMTTARSALLRDRALGGRSAHRRDPRRRHRHRRHQLPRVQEPGRGKHPDALAVGARVALALRRRRIAHYATEAIEHEAFAMSLLEARGEMTLDGPEAEAFIQSKLKATTMHEVGHTLGLTHNFRASTVYTDAQLADREFTKRARPRGLGDGVQRPSTSRCEGERQGEYHMSTLGPYDYWAIEYGYRELAPRARRRPSSRASRAAASEPAPRVHGRRRALLQRPRSARRTRSTSAPIRSRTPSAS